MAICNHCGNGLEENAAFCPVCGAATSGQPPLRRGGRTAEADTAGVYAGCATAENKWFSRCRICVFHRRMVLLWYYLHYWCDFVYCRTVTDQKQARGRQGVGYCRHCYWRHCDGFSSAGCAIRFSSGIAFVKNCFYLYTSYTVYCLTPIPQTRGIQNGWRAFFTLDNRPVGTYTKNRN